jgi:hypothetical protein
MPVLKHLESIGFVRHKLTVRTNNDSKVLVIDGREYSENDSIDDGRIRVIKIAADQVYIETHIGRLRTLLAYPVK